MVREAVRDGVTGAPLRDNEASEEQCTMTPHAGTHWQKCVEAGLVSLKFHVLSSPHRAVECCQHES